MGYILRGSQNALKSPISNTSILPSTIMLLSLEPFLWAYFASVVVGQGDPEIIETDLYSPREPYSPYSYPSPNTTGLGGWDIAILKAKRFVAQLTLEEKVSICTGNGFPADPLVGEWAQEDWLLKFLTEPPMIPLANAKVDSVPYLASISPVCVTQIPTLEQEIPIPMGLDLPLELLLLQRETENC